MGYPIISADSHITEHPDTYTAYIDSAWRDNVAALYDIDRSTLEGSAA